MFNLTSMHTDKAGRIVKQTHYIRLKNGQEPPIYIQNNKFLYEDGAEVYDPPGWIFNELKKCSEQQLRAVNFSLQEVNSSIGDKLNANSKPQRNMDSKGSA